LFLQSFISLRILTQVPADDASSGVSQVFRLYPRVAVVKFRPIEFPQIVIIPLLARLLFSPLPLRHLVLTRGCFCGSARQVKGSIGRGSQVHVILFLTERCFLAPSLNTASACRKAGFPSFSQTLSTLQFNLGNAAADFRRDNTSHRFSPCPQFVNEWFAICVDPLVLLRDTSVVSRPYVPAWSRHQGCSDYAPIVQCHHFPPNPLALFYGGRVAL